MQLSYFPYQGLGQVKFGMNGNEICKAMDIHELDAVYSEGINHFGIDSNNHSCSIIEVVAPLEVLFEEMDLLHTSIRDIREWLLNHDSKAIISFDGMISLKYGFNIYTENLLTDSTSFAEAVIFFEEGYYEDDIISRFLKSQKRFLEVEREMSNKKQL